MSILIDFSQVIISNLFVGIGTIQDYTKKESQSNTLNLPDFGEIVTGQPDTKLPGKPGDKTVINEDMLRHMILNILRYYKMKFGEKYGNLIICCDNNHYWRKDVFPYYKANRKKTRDKSALDWHMIFESLNKIRDEIDVYLPYRVINVNNSEADDLIGVISKIEKKNGPVLIISNDKDFIQLIDKNVSLYRNISKELWVFDDSPTIAI